MNSPAVLTRSSVAIFLGAIIRTVADEGRTVVFSSHLLDEVDRVADRVAMIHAGKLVLCGELDEVKAGHRHLTLRFEQPPTGRPELPGALNCEGEGREWTVLCWPTAGWTNSSRPLMPPERNHRRGNSLARRDLCRLGQEMKVRGDGRFFPVQESNYAAGKRGG